MGMPGHGVGDELLNVDGVEEGLTHAVVVEGGLLGVEHQERQVESLGVVDGRTGVREHARRWRRARSP